MPTLLARWDIMPITIAGRYEFAQGRMGILGRAISPMPSLHFASCHRSTFALDPFDQPALVAVIVGFGQPRVDSPGFGLEPLGQLDAGLHAFRVYHII